MRKKVSVARALKEKNRLVGRIAALRQAIGKDNSHELGAPRSIDVSAALAEAESLKNRLVAVKAAIAFANQGIVAKIVELAEVKSEIAWLKGLDVKEGVYQENSYGNKIVREYEVAVSGADVVRMVDALRRRAELLQDELDEFNGSAKVEIEVDA